MDKERQRRESGEYSWHDFAIQQSEHVGQKHNCNDRQLESESRSLDSLYRDFRSKCRFVKHLVYYFQVSSRNEQFQWNYGNDVWIEKCFCTSLEKDVVLHFYKQDEIV